MRSLNDRLLRHTLVVLLAMTIMLAPCQAAIEFDGADDYIDLKTLPLTNTSNFTISTWVNLNSIPAPYATIISLEESMGYLRIDINSARQAYGYIFTGVQNYIGLTTLNLNQWYNLTYTRNGTDYRFFVDGLLQESRTLLNPVAGVGIEALGARNTTGSNYNINGTIDDTKIYNRPLSNGEVLALYNSHSKRPSGSLANGLIAHYEMDDDAIDEVAAQAKDSSGNFNHGQFIGFDNLTTALKNDVPVQIGTGASLEFDGVNDYIDTVDDGASNGVGPFHFDDTQEWTITTWYKGFENEINSHYGKALLGRDNNDFWANLILRNGRAEYIHYDGSWQHNIISSNAINDGQWHLISYINHSNATGDLYIDSNPDIVGASSTFNDPTRRFVISSLMRGYNNKFTSGLIDDTRIYNRSLTSSEISFLYNGSGLDPGTSNLQALWTFDDDSALKDSSGNNNHGVGIGGNSLKYTDGVLKR